MCSLFMVGLAHSPGEEQDVVPSLQQAVHVPGGHRYSPELLIPGGGEARKGNAKGGY